MAMSKMNKNDAVITALGHPVRRAILRRLENNAKWRTISEGAGR
jgi:DNA-binding transcriptional ArsR family regulator